MDRRHSRHACSVSSAPKPMPSRSPSMARLVGWARCRRTKFSTNSWLVPTPYPKSSLYLNGISE